MRTIFAVDDDTDFLEELSMALELYGYKVMTNSDPNEAIKQAKEMKPDCILFDLKMPQKHGFQFFEALKGDHALRRIPAIAMTGFYNGDYDVCLDAFGILRLLKKPFTPNDVIGMISSVLK